MSVTTAKGRFTTFEEIEELRLIVLKRDGREREPFSRDKLRRAIEIACRKRPISDAQIAQVVDTIERNLFSRQEKEIPSAEIGELLMEQLRALDPVAYVRFASVYRQFEDAAEFKKFVDVMRPRRTAK